MEEYSYENIWAAYQKYATTAAVLRKGFELSGMTEKTGDTVPDIAESFRLRGESDLEHQAKVAWLALVFLRMFWPVQRIDVYLFIAVALCHDVGEIEIGDIPDNGSPLHDSKDSLERKVFEEMARQAFPSCEHELIKMFVKFQDRENFGLAICALDKLEAALMQLLCEKHGNGGSIDDGDATDQDRALIRFTGTTATADVWAARMCSRIDGFPDWVKSPVLKLLDTAVRDVRGASFSWWQKII